MSPFVFLSLFFKLQTGSKHFKTVSDLRKTPRFALCIALMTVEGGKPPHHSNSRKIPLHPSTTPISFSGKETAANSNGKNGKTGLFHL
jgi:hypothetical protein